MTCANPYCRDGWVAFGREIVTGQGPCYVCRVHVAPEPRRREDNHTSTVDGARGAEFEFYGQRRGPLFDPRADDRPFDPRLDEL